MNAYVYPSPRERVISGAGAFGMHLAFVALLVFGVNWQKKVEPQANIVELWTNLQPQVQPVAAPPPPPPPPVPEVKPKVQPVEPPKAVVKPEIAKPDIALKDKAAKDRRVIEEKKKEAKRPEVDTQAAQKQQQAKEAEAQRLAALEQAEAQRKLTEQQAAAQNKMIEEYRAKIQAAIFQKMQPFDNLPKDTYADVEIIVLPDGNVLAVNLKKNSASAIFNKAVDNAILKAQPLPVPKDPALFSSYFRRMDLTFRPKQ